MAPGPTERRRPALGDASLRTTAMLVGASAASAALGYLWTVVTGRLLPAAEYADFSAAASIVYFAATAMAPCSQTLAYFTAFWSNSGDFVSAWELERRALRLIAITGLAVSVVVASTSTHLATLLHFRSPESLVLATLAAIGVGALHIKRGRLLGQQQFRRYSANIVGESIARILLSVALLWFAVSASSSLSGYLAALVVALMFLGWKRTPRRAIDMVAIRRYFAPAFAYTIVYAGFQNIDVLIARRLFSASEAGIYGAASFLSRSAGMLVMPFVAFAIPHLVEVAGEPAEMRRRFIRICTQYTVLALSAVTMIGSCSQLIVRFLFGTGYAPAAGLLLPLSAGAALSGFVFLVCQLPVATNRFGFVKWYALGLLGELSGIAAFHRRLIDIALVLIITNVITLALVAPFLRARGYSNAG
jgi:O-antigen/teichoic acid export membrane protein